MSDRIAKLVERNRAGRAGRFRYEDGEWMSRRYAEGIGLNQLAREAECSLRTVARWMKIHGIATRARGVNPLRAARRPRVRPTFNCACGGTMSEGAAKCWGCRNVGLRGENNYNYQGTADVMVMLRQRIAATWRPAVYERDGYRCCRCGDKSGGNLNAHHIVSLSVLVRSKREAWLPDLSSAEGRTAFVERLTADAEVMDLDNGETLCKPCHRDHHRGPGTYAYAGATGNRRAS